MVDWHRIFSQKILERGATYLQNGSVSEFKPLSTCQYSASVSGSKEYQVCFEVDQNNHIKSFHCDCPYFESGDNCKHVAAVLMKWEQTNQILTNSETANHQDLKTVAEIRHEVAKIRYAFLGRADFIDCYRARDFLYEMSDYLAVCSEYFLRQNQLADAFEVTNLLLRKFLDTPMDDDGEIGEFCGQVLEIWPKIYAQSDEMFLQNMFDWFTKQLGQSEAEVHYVESYSGVIEEFWNQHFNSAAFYQSKLQLIEQKIKFYQHHQKAIWLSEYELEKWILAKVQLLINCEKPKSTIEEYFSANLHYPKMRQLYVNWLIDQKNYNKSLKMIYQFLKTQAKSQYYKTFYYQKLLYIYTELKDVNKQKEFLLELIKLNCEVRDHYHKLKLLYSQVEWSQCREQVIISMPYSADRAYFYNQEKLFEHLLEEVSADGTGELLQTYDGVLSKSYPANVLALYKKFLSGAVQTASNRKYYHYIIDILRRVKRLPSGEELAQELVATWQEKYKKRCAMLDELKNL